LHGFAETYEINVEAGARRTLTEINWRLRRDAADTDQGRDGPRGSHEVRAGTDGG
jgi:hypothetical protein